MNERSFMSLSTQSYVISGQQPPKDEMKDDSPNRHWLANFNQKVNNRIKVL